MSKNGTSKKNSKVYGRASKPKRLNPGMPELKACRARVSKFACPKKMKKRVDYSGLNSV